MNFDKLDPHSFCDRNTMTWTAHRFDGDVMRIANGVVVAAAGGVGGDGGTGGDVTTAIATETVGSDVVVGGDADANASKSLRNYACYNYYPRIYHRRQGVVLNCMMVLCLAICNEMTEKIQIMNILTVPKKQQQQQH